MKGIANSDAKDLELALSEIETAFKRLGRDPAEKIDASAAARRDDLNFGSYLDARGYIFYRQGKHNEALAVLFDESLSFFWRTGQSN